MPSAEAEDEIITNDTIVEMQNVELGDKAIIITIKRSKTSFDLDAQALIRLRNSGVSNAVIEAMLEANAMSTVPIQSHSDHIPRTLLPQHYGTYLITGNEITEIRALSAVKNLDISNGFKILLFSKRVAGLMDSVALYRMKYVRTKLVFGMNRRNNKSTRIEEWKILPGKTNQVDLVAEPVIESQDMIYMYPRRPLAAGVYALVFGLSAKSSLQGFAYIFGGVLPTRDDADLVFTIGTQDEREILKANKDCIDVVLGDPKGGWQAFIQQSSGGPRISPCSETPSAFTRGVALAPTTRRSHSGVRSKKSSASPVIAYRTALQNEQKRVLALRPSMRNKVETLKSSAALARNLGKFQEAAVAYKNILAIDPNNYEAHLGLGAAMSRIGKRKEALLHYDKAEAQIPDSPDVHLERAIHFAYEKPIAQTLAVLEDLSKTGFAINVMSTRNDLRWPRNLKKDPHFLRLMSPSLDVIARSDRYAERFLTQSARIYATRQKTFLKVQELLEEKNDVVEKADKSTGLIVTRYTQHGIIGLPKHFRRYFVLVEETEKIPLEVSVKLIRVFPKFDASTKTTSILPDENGTAVAAQASEFLAALQKKLSDAEPIVSGGSIGPFGHGTLVTKMSQHRYSIATSPEDATHIHLGVDVIARPGAQVVAAANGTVHDVILERSDNDWPELGYAVIVQHDAKLDEKTTFSAYFHLNSPPQLRPGDRVQKGETIMGQVSQIGNATAPHLHFELRHFASRKLLEPGWHDPWSKFGVFGPKANATLRLRWSDPVEYFGSETPGLPFDAAGVGSFLKTFRKNLIEAMPAPSSEGFLEGSERHER